MPEAMSDAVKRLIEAPSLGELARRVDAEPVTAANGLWGSSVAAAVAAVHQSTGRPVLLVCGHLDEADDLADDVELFTGRRPAILPALEVSGALGSASEEQASNRLRLLATLAGKVEKHKPRVIVAAIQSLMQSVPARADLKHLLRRVGVGDQIEIEKIIVWLSDHGYNRLEQVEVAGDFAVRGGIIDVYLPGDFPSDDGEGPGEVGLPVRIDFFGDQIESIKRFEPGSLGSTQKLQEVELVDLKGQLQTGGAATHFMSYLPENAVVALWAPLEIAEQAKAYLDRLPDQRGVYPLSALLKNAAAYRVLELSQFDQGITAMPTLVGNDAPKAVKLPVTSLQKFETEAKKAVQELAELAATHDVTVFCENAGEAKRFRELLAQDAPDAAPKIQTPVGYLHRGFVFDLAACGFAKKEDDFAKPQAADGRPLALLGHHELFHRYEMRRRVKKVVASKPVDSFVDLGVGDYVVHVAHGIAKFTGIQTIEKDGKSEEYLTLRFAENAQLHVPLARINLIQKYIGGFHGAPNLSRLGSGAWERQKDKVAEAVMDMASELIEVQAARSREVGNAYPPDTEWQGEFEAEFPYEPTDDQVTGNEEIKADMMMPKPMDRLLCGDVGYGKTELAMRAAFKAAESGKQVAVLVPTTVLAEQHERSFRERMANYPFEIASISRFKRPKEVKQVLKRAAAGDVDVVIGTHRLLSKDVKFSDLGLVIVDEEQRFGVTHKERLKQMRAEVDVLTMSATPIPRTLHMSMVGIRDISSLTTAPQDRRSIVTEVMGFDRERVKLAILRELQRDGQVYFVHNRVSNIIEIADELQQLVPEARIIVGHGQMDEGELEQVMLKFIRHEADILVATTIIESGLDIPNANTICINNADRFGLSELHQLRGRVGRYKHRAYCYLLLPSDRPITPVASKRLKAIEEYSHLGAGFKIAMKDLELRGAGNILGPEQSGHIATVGYEMYCQLLEEAVQQLKNEKPPPRPDAHVEIGITSSIPKSYVSADKQRMDLYRRLTRCTSMEMLAELKADMADAFGPPPRAVDVLFGLIELKLLAATFGIDSVVKKDQDVVLKVNDAQKAQQVLAKAPGSLRVIDAETVYLRMPPTFLEPETLLMVLRNLMHTAWEKSKPAA